MKKLNILIVAICTAQLLNAQGLHFSQFYNTPLLLNPANTALLPDDDIRGGINYRTQFSKVPVPYITNSAFVDMGLNRTKNENSWLGVGLGVWDDKAGDGNLRLTKVQGTAAYHIITDEHTMWSVGLGLASVSRSINFSNLTYLSQWDEFSFNNNLPSQENVRAGKTSYLDANLGASYTYHTEDKYDITFSGSVLHVNQPKETFLSNGKNRIGMRPVFSLDANFKSGENLLISPAVYYTTQKGASELVFGAMSTTNLSRRTYMNTDKNLFLLGAYHRLGDAVIFSSGYQFNNYKLMASYDYTISKLASAISGYGAFEVSLIYQGKYRNYTSDRRTFGCPRF
jgi:type IX secretion system PorP/SprF family membrane protein